MVKCWRVVALHLIASITMGLLWLRPISLLTLHPTNIAWLKFSGKFLTGLGIPSLGIKITLEPNPRKSRILVRRLTAFNLCSHASCDRVEGWQTCYPYCICTVPHCTSVLYMYCTIYIYVYVCIYIYICIKHSFLSLKGSGFWFGMLWQTNNLQICPRRNMGEHTLAKVKHLLASCESSLYASLTHESNNITDLGLLGYSLQGGADGGGCSGLG